MNERQAILEILNVLKQVVTEVTANDSETLGNLRGLELEILDIAERFQDDKN